MSPSSFRWPGWPTERCGTGEGIRWLALAALLALLPGTGRGWQKLSVPLSDAMNAGDHDATLAIDPGVPLDIDSVRFD